MISEASFHAQLARRLQHPPAVTADAPTAPDIVPFTPASGGPLSSLLAGITSHFDDLIASAPHSATAAEESARTLPFPMPSPTPHPVAPPAPVDLPLLRAVHGWPERFCQDLGQPHGEAWLAAFARVRQAVAQGGIVLLHGTRGPGKSRMAMETARLREFPYDRAPATTPAGPGLHTGGRSAPRAARTRTAVYRTAMRFFLELRDTYRRDSGRSELQVVDALISPGLLVLDEMQERGGSDFENQFMTHLIDARYAGNRPTILIANLGRHDFCQSLGPSIVDRVMENGVRVECTWPSYRRRPGPPD